MCPKSHRWAMWKLGGTAVLPWLVVFALVGLRPMVADVKSTNGTINFDSNFDGAPEAVLNSRGFGLGTTNPSANLQVEGNAMMSGTMVVGGTSNASGSNLHVNGSWGFSVQTVTGNTPLSGSVVLADTTAGNIVLTLPAASAVSGRVYTVKKTSNSHTLLLGSATPIDGLPGVELSSSSSAFPYVQVMSDGTTWRILSQSIEGVSSANVCLIVDVSGGSAATSYPVTFAKLSTADLTGADNLQYKMNKIVLRYIPAGTFTMGQTGVHTPIHTVRLTQGFWAGVFEVTQEQWMKVMGGYPRNQSFFNTAAGNTMPMHNVSWEDARGTAGGGYDWPNNGNAVLSTSFMGQLRAKTGLGFDLPTEAQWEYSTRAGTSTEWSYGGTVNGDYMWYGDNNTTNGTKEVGSKLPNPWGLYDVHGNVSEWCLDWYAAYSASPTDDPVGALNYSERVVRDGSYLVNALNTRSAYRNDIAPFSYANWIGLRLFLPL